MALKSNHQDHLDYVTRLSNKVRIIKNNAEKMETLKQLVNL